MAVTGSASLPVSGGDAVILAVVSAAMASVRAPLGGVCSCLWKQEVAWLGGVGVTGAALRYITRVAGLILASTYFYRWAPPARGERLRHAGMRAAPGGRGEVGHGSAEAPARA